jgi:regulator of sigma E protease
MSLLSNLLPFVIAIASLIVVHEIGHFLASKLVGIKVEEFGIGFPPRLVRLFKWRETEFTLNWVPLGGFVRPAGENDPKVPGGLSAAPPWKRLVVLFAGPTMNLLAALFLYALIFTQLGRPDLTVVQVMDISAGSPAEQAGLQNGDVIISIDGETIETSEELHDYIYSHLGQPLTFIYQRGGQPASVQLTPRDPAPEDGAIGIVMGHPSIPLNSFESIGYSAQAIWDQANSLISLPARIASGEVQGDQGRLVGYKGMYDIYTEVREADAAPDSQLPPGVNTLSFFASISVSLGLLNLLPVPALDGGRILFTLPELLFKKRIPQAYENAVNLVGLGLLLLAMVYINLQDFLNPISIP